MDPSGTSAFLAELLMPEPVLGAAFVAMLAAVTVTDLDRRVIPNRILIVAGLIATGITAVAAPDSLAERAIAALAAGAALGVIAVAYPGGMGLGDVKLAAVMGLYLGVAVVAALLVAFVAGALAGFVLVLRHGLPARKQTIPFGPFLAAGGLVSLLLGDQMVAWYLAGL
jgi:leader peptidase (prepilin peptidase)/N-methyltransferase